MIQEVFNQEFTTIKERFLLITNDYQTMEKEIGELKMNCFILAKHVYQNKIKDKTIKLIIYPLVLLIVLFFLLVIFDLYIIPGMKQVMLVFNNNLNLISIFSYFVRMIITIYIMFIIGFCLLIYQINKNPSKV